MAYNSCASNGKRIHPLIVLFDLEATSLKTDSDICQIAALPVRRTSLSNIWSCYLLPRQDVSLASSQINKLKVEETKDKERILTNNGVKVEALEYTDGLLSFYKYLIQLSAEVHSKEPDKKIILTAHYGKRYDVPVLLNAFKNISVTRLKLNELKISFADSYLVLYNMQTANHPILSAQDGPNFSMYGMSLKQTNIYATLFQERYSAHNAVEDVRALHRILFHSTLQVTANDILHNSFEATSV